MLTCVAGVSVMCVGVDVGVCVSMGEEKHLCERESMHASRARKGTCSIFGPGRVQLAKSRKSCALNKVVKKGLFFLLLPVSSPPPQQAGRKRVHDPRRIFWQSSSSASVCGTRKHPQLHPAHGREAKRCVRPADRQYMAINAHLSRTTQSFLLHHVYAWHTS